MQVMYRKSSRQHRCSSAKAHVMYRWGVTEIQFAWYLCSAMLTEICQQPQYQPARSLGPLWRVHDKRESLHQPGTDETRSD